MTDAKVAERIMRVVEAHADTVTIPLLRDLAAALGLRLRVRLLEPEEK